MALLGSMLEWDMVPKPLYWKSALLEIIKQPDRYKPIIYALDRDSIAIYDRYPKAKRHLLILPRDITPSIDKLDIQHLPMLRRLLRFGYDISDSLLAAGSLETGQFKFGFHAIPSLDQLHMHLISTDMQSDFLKNKKHWNSFCTEFFLSPDYVLKQIETNGRVEIDPIYFKRLLEKPLACQYCGQIASNLPKLKDHICSCSKRQVSI